MGEFFATDDFFAAGDFSTLETLVFGEAFTGDGDFEDKAEESSWVGVLKELALLLGVLTLEDETDELADEELLLLLLWELWLSSSLSSGSLFTGVFFTSAFLTTVFLSDLFIGGGD